MNYYLYHDHDHGRTVNHRQTAGPAPAARPRPPRTTNLKLLVLPSEFIQKFQKYGVRSVTLELKVNIISLSNLKSNEKK